MYGDHRDLPSFPTRRSSDLYKVDSVSATEVSFVHLPSGTRQTLQFSALKEQELTAQARTPAFAPAFRPPSPVAKLIPARSEEHTSELQSQSNLVCRLLLENK